MSDSPGRAIVVGYGRMGKFHSKVLRDLGYEVVTVDPHASSGADFGTLDEAQPKFTAEQAWTGVGRPTGFAVGVVAVPPPLLVDTAYELAGVPKLLVEKPFATNTRDALLLAAYLEKCRSDVCVGLVERFNPQARALRGLLHDRTFREVSRLKFTRWNDRPSFDVDLDLKLHDVDLAAWLRSGPEVSFDTRAESAERVRRIEVTHADGVYVCDLMAHNLSPLHGLWHAFLTDGEYPKPADVIRAHRFLDLLRESQEVAA